MKVYIAGPFFTPEERVYLNQMIEEVKRVFSGAELFIPMEHFIPNGEKLSNDEWAKAVYVMDIKALQDSSCVVALYLGHYSDTGTAFELGYSVASGKPVFLYIPEEIRNKDMSIMPIQGCGLFHKIDISTLNQK